MRKGESETTKAHEVFTSMLPPSLCVLLFLLLPAPVLVDPANPDTDCMALKAVALVEEQSRQNLRAVFLTKKHYKQKMCNTFFRCIILL